MDMLVFCSCSRYVLSPSSTSVTLLCRTSGCMWREGGRRRETKGAPMERERERGGRDEGKKKDELLLSAYMHACYAHMYACMYVCMHACMHICVPALVCMHTVREWAGVCVYECMDACMHSRVEAYMQHTHGKRMGCACMRITCISVQRNATLLPTDGERSPQTSPCD